MERLSITEFNKKLENKVLQSEEISLDYANRLYYPGYYNWHPVWGVGFKNYIIIYGCDLHNITQLPNKPMLHVKSTELIHLNFFNF